MNLLIRRISSRYSTGAAHRLDKHRLGHGLQTPRMVSLRKSHAEMLKPFFYEHQRMRQNAMVIDPVAIANTPKVRESAFAEPWKTVNVSVEEVSAFDRAEVDDGSPDFVYDIGPMRDVTNTHPFDVPAAQPSTTIFSRKPGEGIFTEVTPGPYGQREFKYLYLIDHNGMHIVREMTPCPESSRGIPMHSFIKTRGIVAGEIFFDEANPKVAYINFGSARLTFKNAAEADMTARFVLSLGYDKIVAVYPDRDFALTPYDMNDRYGKALANAIYLKESL